ncbi:Uncharacterised protein [Vibrio cholerae]|nr:Uncharacterised protein [Vibrio cholerae]CSI83377.1 Uncharacterised protein [Vibrio cholerae]
MGSWPANASIAASEIPASLGVHGPGEITKCVGASARIPSRSISSLRTTLTCAPNSQKYWYRL